VYNNGIIVGTLAGWLVDGGRAAGCLRITTTLVVRVKPTAVKRARCFGRRAAICDVTTCLASAVVDSGPKTNGPTTAATATTNE